MVGMMNTTHGFMSQNPALQRCDFNQLKIAFVRFLHSTDIHGRHWQERKIEFFNMGQNAKLSSDDFFIGLKFFGVRTGGTVSGHGMSHGRHIDLLPVKPFPALAALAA